MMASIQDTKNDIVTPFGSPDSGLEDIADSPPPGDDAEAKLKSLHNAIASLLNRPCQPGLVLNRGVTSANECELLLFTDTTKYEYWKVCDIRGWGLTRIEWENGNIVGSMRPKDQREMCVLTEIFFAFADALPSEYFIHTLSTAIQTAIDSAKSPSFASTPVGRPPWKDAWNDFPRPTLVCEIVAPEFAAKLDADIDAFLMDSPGNLGRIMTFFGVILESDMASTPQECTIVYQERKVGDYPARSFRTSFSLDASSPVDFSGRMDGFPEWPSVDLPHHLLFADSPEPDTAKMFSVSIVKIRSGIIRALSIFPPCL